MLIDCLEDVEFQIGNNSIFTAKRGVPFEALAIAFLSELSKTILTDPVAKKYPDLITFGFYCRQANINRIKQKYHDLRNRVGWGLALHIAPGNIPLNFGYTFVFGLITGNCNIVRLPSKQFDVVDILCKLIAKVFSKKKFSNLAHRNALVRFSKDSKFLRHNAHQFDLRIIWGGDNTINEMRKYLWSAGCIEIPFRDRYSVAVFNAKFILEQEKEIGILCKYFYNDTFLVDQNACSSPRMIYWVGSEKEIKKARQVFWSQLANYVINNYKMDITQFINKQVSLIKTISLLDSSLQSESFQDVIYTIQIDKLPKNLDENSNAFGVFHEYFNESFDPLFEIITRKFQTLLYYGFDKQLIINKVIDSGVKGIDRVAKIGEALSINIQWDGFDLLTKMTRRIAD